MPKPTSAKKVARAAGLGGSRSYASRPAYNYYIAVGILILLGVLGVYNSREYLDAKNNKQGNAAPAVGTKWFEGYAIDECGKLLPPLKPTNDSNGLTTRNGVIYIEPKVKSVAGHNATLFAFANAVGMKLNAGELQVPGSRLYTDGDSCEGQPGHVYVMTWSNPAEPQSDGVLQNKKSTKGGLEDTCNPDCDSGVLLEDDQLVTIAFLPAPAKGHKLSVPEPPAAVISYLSQVEANGGTPTTTTTAAPTTTSTNKSGHSTTAAASNGSSSSTTAAGKAKGKTKGTATTVPTGTTTTVPSSTTTTSGQATTTSAGQTTRAGGGAKKAKSTATTK